MATATVDQTGAATDEFEVPPADPLLLLQEWLDFADEREVLEPFALALATVDAGSRVSSRIVRFVEAGPDGLLFTTHAGSRKARQFTTSEVASGLLYWREVKRQIEINGPIVPAPPGTADKLWDARPVKVNAVSTAASQSAVLEDEAVLRDNALRLGETEDQLPRPASFQAYLLQPTELEFWAGSKDGIHRRLRYQRAATGWTTERLHP